MEMAQPTFESLLPDELKTGLTSAERIFLERAAKEKVIDFFSGDEELDKPENSHQWGENRALRANLLIWLFTDNEVNRYIPLRGIYILGTKIIGELDLEGAALAFPLGFVGCAILDGIILRDARTRTINFSGSLMGSVNATRLQTEGDVFMRSSQVEGEIQLSGARISGGLNCTGGSFRNPGSYAFVAYGLTTGSDINMSTKFLADGEVSLIGGRVGGNLLCYGASFKNSLSTSLNISGSTINQNVFLSDGFNAEGEVCLLGTIVGKNLDCTRATFKHSGGNTFKAVNLEVTGSFTWVDIPIKPDGFVDLSHARVGQLIDDIESWPEKNKLLLDGFEYGSFASYAPSTADARLGWIDLQPQGEGSFWTQPYEQLANVFRRMGHEADTRAVLIAKQEALRRYGQLGWKAKAWNWFLGKTIAHGYKPWKAFLPIAFFVIVGAGVFSWADSEGIMQPSKERVYLDSRFIESQKLPDRYPRFNSFVYSVDTFFPFVELHQEDYWLPSASFPSKKYLLGEPLGVYFRFYLWFHIFWGWLLSAFAVAALTGLTRKD